MRHRDAIGDSETLERWAHDCQLGSTQALVEAAARPINLVPSSITFYPLRISDNILRRGAELLTGKLSMRAVDELVVEGNILLKATDMDINLGRSLHVDDVFQWFEQPIVRHLARELPNLGAVFDIEYLESRLLRRLATHGANRIINRVRDTYMRRIYDAIVVNLSHLASSIILGEVERGRADIGATEFRRSLYLAIKHLQGHDEIRLHRGLCDPRRYQAVLESEPSALSEFLDSAAGADLIEHGDEVIVLREKLRVEHEFDAVRMANPIEVYGNEVAPLAEVREAVARALTRARSISGAELASELYDDGTQGTRLGPRAVRQGALPGDQRSRNGDRRPEPVPAGAREAARGRRGAHARLSGLAGRGTCVRRAARRSGLRHLRGASEGPRYVAVGPARP